MNLDIFRERYQRFDHKDETIQLSINTILAFEEFLKKDIHDSTIDDLKTYMKYLIDTKANRYNNVIHIARYYYYVDMKDHYIHMTKYFNSLGVLEHIVDRISQFESVDVKEQVLDDFELPPFGTEPDELPHYTKRFMSIMNKYVSADRCNKILAGNNHQIPTSSFEDEKRRYEESESLALYLEDRHQRKVEELTSFYENNQIWFEQIITPDVIEFVKLNQEILSGVVKNDKLYITKIPYDISNYLATDNSNLKQYYACHCSFVREQLKEGKNDIPKEWCYCSAGFAKHPFETILGHELNVTLLNTPLNGDPICRFEIDLTDIPYK